MRRAFVLLAAAALAPQSARAQADTLTLAEAVESALATHPLLDRASAGGDAADAGVRFALAARLPTLTLAGTTTRFAEPMVVAPLHAFDPTMPPRFDRTLVQGRAEAAYRLFDGGARGARIEAARAASAAAEADVRGAREDVLVGVATAYARLAAARSRAIAASERLSAGTAEKARADRLFREGAVAEVETVRAEAERLAGQAEAAAAHARLDVALRELARWMGTGAGSIFARPLHEYAVDAELIHPDTLPSAAVERAAQEARQAEATAAAARAARLPRLDLQAALLEFGSGEGEFQGEWQAGVALLFPAFTGGARGADIDRARATARAANSALELARLRQASAIDREWAALVAAIATTEALRQRVDALFDVYQIAELALQEGAGTQKEMIDAGADYYDALAALAESTAEQVRAMVELGRARGILTIDWISRLLRSAP